MNIPQAQYRDMSIPLKDEGKILFSDRCERVSSDVDNTRGYHSHILKSAKHWVKMILIGPFPDHGDKMQVISEECAFDEFVRHLDEGKVFKKMEDCFSAEQLSRIEEF
jgi:uncharacterized protein YciI